MDRCTLGGGGVLWFSRYAASAADSNSVDIYYFCTICYTIYPIAWADLADLAGGGGGSHLGQEYPMRVTKATKATMKHVSICDQLFWKTELYHGLWS